MGTFQECMNEYREQLEKGTLQRAYRGFLVENPDFSDLVALTEQIAKGAVKFIEDINNFLSKHSEQV